MRRDQEQGGGGGAGLCELVWPSGKALAWYEGPLLDSASALLSLRKGCGLWAVS